MDLPELSVSVLVIHFDSFPWYLQADVIAIHSFHIGVELLTQSNGAGEQLLKMLWHYQDAILCCSFKVYKESDKQIPT
jgi:hypothetical protein